LQFDSKNKTQKILHAIKYGDSPEIAVRLSAIWADRIKESLMESKIDLIMPIPLHKSKMRKRGYNQATKIAEALDPSKTKSKDIQEFLKKNSESYKKVLD
jgi:amidophosphoribosyltransferase